MKHQTVIKNVLVEKVDKDVSFTNPVAVFLDRRTRSNPFMLNPLEQIGVAKLEKRQDGIYATLHISVSGNAVKGLYPNVGVKVDYAQISAADSRIIQGNIICVNISRFTNKDKSIPVIKLN